MTRCKQVLVNLFELKALDFNNINSPIRELEGKTIKTLIISLKEEKGSIVFIVVECSQQDYQSLWAKKKYKKVAEEYTAYLPAQLVKEYREAVLTKLDLYVQYLVSSIVWIDRVPLYLDDIAID